MAAFWLTATPAAQLLCDDVHARHPLAGALTESTNSAGLPHQCIANEPRYAGLAISVAQSSQQITVLRSSCRHRGRLAAIGAGVRLVSTNSTSMNPTPMIQVTWNCRNSATFGLGQLRRRLRNPRRRRGI